MSPGWGRWEFLALFERNKINGVRSKLLKKSQLLGKAVEEPSGSCLLETTFVVDLGSRWVLGISGLRFAAWRWGLNFSGPAVVFPGGTQVLEFFSVRKENPPSTTGRFFSVLFTM